MEQFRWGAIPQGVIASMNVSCFEDFYFSRKSPNIISQNLLVHGLQKVNILTCIWLEGGELEERSTNRQVCSNHMRGQGFRELKMGPGIQKL